LEEMGSVTFVDHPNSADVDAVLREGLRLEADGWKGRQGVAVLSDPKVERWYRAVAEIAQGKGWLRLSSLYLDERLVAFSLDLVYGNRRYGKISAYDESPDVAFSTGSLLLEAILERSAETGLATYELGYGNHDWKYDWTSHEHRVHDVLILGSGLIGMALSTMRNVQQWGRRRPPSSREQ
jgi:CelD/BcsL family acetyltransferase involved in cellulose biosynthesis